MHTVQNGKLLHEKTMDFVSEEYPVMEHPSNAYIMPLTGPYGRLDLFDTFEYTSVPEDPVTPMESYEIVYEKNMQK